MHFTTIATTEQETTGSGNAIWRLLPETIGVPNFELRYFEVPEGGATSRGSHPWEHEVFVVKGKGLVRGADIHGAAIEQSVEPGHAVYVAPNEEHQFVNDGREPFGFICVCPKGYE